MNKRTMEKWVKALRSGKYKQGTGRLRRNTDRNEFEYCCLGVACEIGIASPTGSIVYSFGLPLSNKLLTVKGQDHLIDLNDSKKWSFKRIATYIEKNYKKL